MGKKSSSRRFLVHPAGGQETTFLFKGGLNDKFSCSNPFETKKSRRVGEQMFDYVLLAAVTLLPESELHKRRTVGEHQVGE